MKHRFPWEICSHEWKFLGTTKISREDYNVYVCRKCSLSILGDDPELENGCIVLEERE